MNYLISFVLTCVLFLCTCRPEELSEGEQALQQKIDTITEKIQDMAQPSPGTIRDLSNCCVTILDVIKSLDLKPVNS